jgi:hypothetical protein
MTKDKKIEGCVQSAAGPVVSKTDAGSKQLNETREEISMNVTVGKEAPDFEAAAYYEGGFKNIKLSDYRGKWVFLCFYPGDFTFV